MKERLQKIMAEAGIASRRKCEEIIVAGRVSVNGVIIKKLGTTALPSDKIIVDGKPIRTAKKVYILLNKPAGYICSTQDFDDRPLVTNLVRERGVRLFTVGRLDYDTEGAIILTNDGDFSLKVSHPRYEVNKVYEVIADGIVEDDALKRLEKGIVLDGRRLSGTKILRSQKFNNRTFVEISIHEGRNRQIKRMFEIIGHRISRLKRTRIGFLYLGSLKSGQYRYLTPEEVKRFLSPKQ